jgi:hypothetical protein
VKTVRGQLDEIIRMLESDVYCVEVMKQIQVVQWSLERAKRVTFGHVMYLACGANDLARSPVCLSAISSPRKVP